MGISSDGVLVFGFVIGDEEETPEFLMKDDEEMEFDDFVLSRVGHTDESYDSSEVYKARRAAVERCPADMTLFCSYDCPMYILAVRGTEVSVRRGATAVIAPESLVIDPARIAAFQAWCEEVGIEYHEPQWLLCSMYG